MHRATAALKSRDSLFIVRVASCGVPVLLCSGMRLVRRRARRTTEIGTRHQGASACPTRADASRQNAPCARVFRCVGVPDEGRRISSVGSRWWCVVCFHSYRRGTDAPHAQRNDGGHRTKIRELQCTLKFCVAIVVTALLAIGFTTLPSAGSAGPSNAALAKRVVRLETRIARLEKRTRHPRVSTATGAFQLISPAVIPSWSQGQATCPASTTVVGGGVRFVGTYGNLPIMEQSYPTQSNGWAVTLRFDGTPTAPAWLPTVAFGHGATYTPRSAIAGRPCTNRVDSCQPLAE